VIHYLKHHEINQSKWDKCIDQSPLGLPYAYSWYLDAVTGQQWDALEMNDYELVMPLPWNKKLGFKQVYQPHPCQQLGVFGAEVSAEHVRKMWDDLALYFLQCHMSWNHTNATGEHKYDIRLNYILPLNKPYEELHKGFAKGRKSDISKALRNGSVREISLPDFLSFFQKNSPLDREEVYTDENAFKAVMEAAVDRDRGQAYGYFVGEALAAAHFFVMGRTRIVNLMSVNDKLGRENGGSAAVLNHIIQNYASTEHTLDFEGSMIPGIASFFKSFGAQKETYFYMEKNIPGIKSLKKLFGK